MDLNKRWNDYCKENCTDKMYFADAEHSVLVTIAEGSGDNLEKEDIAEGYVDYWYGEVYTTKDGNCGGGFQLLTTLIQQDNKTLSEIIDEIIEADIIDGIQGLPLKDMLINPSDGEDIEYEFEEAEMRRIENLNVGA